MRITSDFLANIEAKKDKVLFTRVYDPTPAMKQAHEDRKDLSQGWSKDRTMRRIASIPPQEFFKHPEWEEELIAYGDSPSMRKWLQTEYGSLFKTVEHI